MSIEEYVKEMIEGGYIAEDGAPLKCPFCESNELETYNNHENMVTVVEKIVYCNQCDEKVGHWDYGSWSL